MPMVYCLLRLSTRIIGFIALDDIRKGPVVHQVGNFVAWKKSQSSQALYQRQGSFGNFGADQLLAQSRADLQSEFHSDLAIDWVMNSRREAGGSKSANDRTEFIRTLVFVDAGDKDQFT